MSRAAPLLRVAGLSVRYGAIEAVRGVDLAVGAREIVAIVGPNGAGKTSLLSAIAGIVPPAAGRIEFDAQPLHRFPACHKWLSGSGGRDASGSAASAAMTREVVCSAAVSPLSTTMSASA